MAKSRPWWMNKWRLGWAGVATTILAIIVPNCVNTCHHNQDRLDKRRIEAVVHRPELHVFDGVKCDSIRPKPTIYFPRGARPYFTGPVVLELHADAENSTSQLAHIVCWGFAEGIDGSDMFRTMLQDPAQRRSSIGFQVADDDFQNYSLGLGQSRRIDGEVQLIPPATGEITIHFIIVYQNELGDVFDSYAWRRLRVNRPNIELHMKPGGMGEFLIFPPPEGWVVDGRYQEDTTAWPADVARAFLTELGWKSHVPIQPKDPELRPGN